MKLRDAMTGQVKMIAPSASLREAAKQMRDLGIGALPVCDGDRLVGMLTDRDISVRSVAAGDDPNTTLVKDAMTSPIHYCFEDDDLRSAARTMEENQVRRLAVLNSDKRLIGMISLKDLAMKGQFRQTVGLFSLLGGLLSGASVMFLLDPRHGKRRRAHARDKAYHFARLTQHESIKRARHLRNRARGIVAEARANWKKSA